MRKMETPDKPIRMRVARSDADGYTTAVLR